MVQVHTWFLVETTPTYCRQTSKTSPTAQLQPGLLSAWKSFAVPAAAWATSCRGLHLRLAFWCWHAKLHDRRQKPHHAPLAYHAAAWYGCDVVLPCCYAPWPAQHLFQTQVKLTLPKACITMAACDNRFSTCLHSMTESAFALIGCTLCKLT